MKKIFKIIFLEIVTSIKETINYKISMLTDLVTLFSLYSALIFMKSGSLLDKFFPVYTSKELLLLGYIFWAFSILAINNIPLDIVKESQRGTLEYKFMSIVPIEVHLIGRYISSILSESFIIFFLFILNFILFKIPIILNFKIIVILIITLIGMLGFGFILGSLALKEKKIGNFLLLIQILLLLLGNIISINSFVNKYSFLIPLTKGVNLARNNINTSFQEILIFFLYNLFIFGLGILIFRMSIKNQKKKGSLGFY